MIAERLTKDAPLETPPSGERIKQARQNECMKYVFLVLVIGGIGSGLFWYMTENAKADRAEAYRREQIRLEKEEAEQNRKREEEEKIAKEQMAQSAKDNAVRLFLRYLDCEETQLKQSVEEGKLQLQKLDLDLRSLSDELLAIERANEARISSAKKRGEKQRDKIERVSAILKSPVINRLFSTYCGEDLSALRSEYLSEVQRVKDVDDVYRKKRAANRERFDEEIKGADDEVGKRLDNVKEKLAKATAGTKQNVAALKQRLANIQKTVGKLEEKDKKAATKSGPKLTPWEKLDLERLQSQRAIVETQLEVAQNQLEYGDVDAAQSEAIVAEKRARSRVDTAIVRMRDADVIIQEERDHEQDIHNLARAYEIKSLDRVRAAMMNYGNTLSSAMAADKKKIEFLHEASSNLDFLNAKEVEAMRKKVARRLASQITGDAQK